MVFCADDQALLSFLDEFPFDEQEDEGFSTVSSNDQSLQDENEVALVSRGPTTVVTSSPNGAELAEEELTRSMPRCKAPLILGSNKDEETKRKKVNERKKLLRKTGVYGDPNRA